MAFGLRPPCMIIQVFYVFVSPLQGQGLMLTTCPPQTSALSVATDVCSQRDNKLLKDQVMGFLSLLHICHTQCWAQRQCSVLVSGLGRGCEKWQGPDQHTVTSTCHQREGMRTLYILLMFCTALSIEKPQ